MRQTPAGAVPSVPTERRCEALIRDGQGRPTQERCRCVASVRFGDRVLCGKHAGTAALGLALESGAAVMLPNQPAQPGAIRFCEERDRD